MVQKLRRYQYHFFLHIIVFIWGFTAILGKLILLPTNVLVLYRMVIAALGLACFALYKGTSLKLSTKGLLQIVGVGLLVAAHWICFFQAIKVSNVSITLAVLSSTAFFVALVEPIVYKRRVLVYELALGGVVMGALFWIFKSESQYSWGIFLTLIASIIVSFFAVFNGKLIEKYSPTVITFYEMIGGSLGILMYILVEDSTQLKQLPSLNDWIYLLVLGLICTAFAFAASVALLRMLTPYTIALTTNLEPVYGIVMAYFLFRESEQMTSNFYWGALVIFLSVLLNAYFKQKRDRKIAVKSN